MNIQSGAFATREVCSTETVRPGEPLRRRVTEIDLLRFLAALAVVIFHYAYRGYAHDDLSVMPYPWLAPVAKYGYLGVELFFMISGFVVLMSASNGSLRKFFVSRVVRLYPAFWICCTLTALTTVLWGGDHFTVSLSQYVINLTMLNEFVGVASVDGAYWSLAVEIKFYILIGIVLAAGQIRRAELLVLLWLAATVALEALAIGRLRWLLMTEYSPLFIAGALCYLIHSKGLRPWRVVGLVTAWAIVASRALRAPAAETDPLIVAGACTVFFILMFLVSIGRTGFFGHREWLALGALTYPLYLLHQVIGYIVFNAAYPLVSPHLLLWGMLAAVLVLSYLICRLVEPPLGRELRKMLNCGFDHCTRLVRSRVAGVKS